MTDTNVRRPQKLAITTGTTKINPPAPSPVTVKPAGDRRAGSLPGAAATKIVTKPTPNGGRPPAASPPPPRAAKAESGPAIGGWESIVGSYTPPPPPIEPKFRVADICRPYFKLGNIFQPHAAGAGPWSVTDLCAAYQWPTGLAGGGAIAIVELGGGWVHADLAAFFASIGQPMPDIVDVSLDGVTNKPDPDPEGADGEVALDIEVAAAAYFAATGKPAQIRVYWASDIATAVRAATKDGCDVCSISWGADEAAWGAAAAADMEKAAAAAVAAGMLVFAASGDNDSGDGGSTPANVDLPASAPHVIGCGGTSKTRSTEAVWNNNPGQTNGEGTGGGFSTIFPAQPWQVHAPKAPAGLGRMVPDVSANADPDTGYEIYFHGARQIIGGTSAVAPLYAGLFAAFGKKLGSAAVQGAATLWGNAGCFTDIVHGDNGEYSADVGPDPCTGLGAPIGRALAVFAATSVHPPVPAPPPPAPLPTPVPPPADSVTLEHAQEWAVRGLAKQGPLITKAHAEALVKASLAMAWPK